MPYARMPDGTMRWVTDDGVTTSYYPGLGNVTYQEYAEFAAAMIGMQNGWDPWGLNGASVSSPGGSGSQPITPPTYVPPPPPPPPPPQPSIFDVVVREGFKIGEGDFQYTSSGPIKANNISGWSNAIAAKDADGNYATTTTPSGADYTDKLVAKDFDFSSLPAGAAVIGIRVTVKRRKSP